MFYPTKIESSKLYNAEDLSKSGGQALELFLKYMYQTFITLKIHLYEISSFVKLLFFLQSAVLYQSSNSVVGVGLSEFSLNGPSSGSHYTLFLGTHRLAPLLAIYTRGEC